MAHGWRMVWWVQVQVQVRVRVSSAGESKADMVKEPIFSISSSILHLSSICNPPSSTPMG
jgi:hypothetical protein